MSREHAEHQEPSKAEAPIQRKLDDDQASFQKQSLGELGAIQRKSGAPSVRDQSLGEIGSVVQRNAGGDAAQTADVQQTAQAGVAGPGSALPHGDRIQAAFGRHDVSSVKAHVGGDAAAAAGALDANAYATGDNVAFAAPPDLHTAAHEAAHTVQQSAGVVSFKGVNPSGDQHEQQADAVADAVVAGESAEPLLDSMVGDKQAGGNASSETIQRDDRNKGKADPKPQLTDADQVILANIVAAQNELDELDKYLDKFPLGGKKSPDFAQVQQKVVRATLYIAEARQTMPNGSATNSQIADALASIHGIEIKVENYIHLRAAGAPAEDDAVYRGLFEGLWQRFLEHEGTLMRKYGIPKKPAHVSTIGRGKDGSAPEVAAVKASLHLAEVEAQRGFDLLVAHTGDFESRVTIVKNTSILTYGHIGHASTMLLGLDETQKQLLLPQVEATSKPLLLMKRWMDGRQGNANMISAFSNVMLAINGTRTGVGLKELDMNQTAGFPEREEFEEINEKRDMDASVGKFAEAWESVSAAMEEGVEQWFELAKKGEQKKPSFSETLLSTLITTVLGNIGGVIVKNMITVADNDAVKQAIQDIASGVMSDASQSIMGPAINEGIAKAGEDPDLKALLFVRSALKRMCRGLKSENVTKLHDRIAKGKLSVAQVAGLEKSARNAEKTAEQNMKVHSATDWTRYVAQSALGQAPAGGAKGASDNVTNMDGYFGEFTRGGPRQKDYYAGNKAGTSGVLKVEVRNFDWSINGQIGTPVIQNMNLIGLNEEMAKLIMADAKTLDDVKVPKEVHIQYKIFKGRNTYANPWLKLAIDENGNIKHSRAEEDKDERAPDEGATKWNEIRKLAIDPGKIE